jgi:hypothetical protein
LVFALRIFVLTARVLKLQRRANKGAALQPGFWC